MISRFRFSIRSLIMALILLAGCARPPAAAAQNPILTVEAGALAREHCIVEVPFDLPAWQPAFDPQTDLLQLASDAETIPAQWDADAGTLLFVVVEPLTSGSQRAYTLTVEAGGLEPPYVFTHVPGDYLVVGHTPDDGATTRPIMRYNQGIQPYPSDLPQDDYLDRSGYIHPLWTPGGHVVSGDMQPDHDHQRGLFFAWTDGTFKTAHVNFWELEFGHSETQAEPLFEAGPVFARVVARNDQVTNTGDPVLDETLTYRIFAGLPGGNFIDIRVRNEAVEEPLQINVWNYGGMAIRGIERWWFNQSEVAFSSSTGLPGRSADADPATWCDMTGEVGTVPSPARAGVTIFDRPENPRYPTRLRIHPNKPYFNFAYHQTQGLVIDQDNPIELHYRVLTHDGDVDEALTDAMAADLAEPATVGVDIDGNNPVSSTKWPLHE
jgi:hypothetical protein